MTQINSEWGAQMSSDSKLSSLTDTLRFKTDQYFKLTFFFVLKLVLQILKLRGFEVGKEIKDITGVLCWIILIKKNRFGLIEELLAE